MAALAGGCASIPAATVPSGTPLTGNSFVVRDVRVFDGEQVHERVHLVVRGGRIVAVGGAAPPSDLPVIDGSGHTMLPGLIDAHGHVQGELSLRDALRFGVTTVLDMLMPANVAKQLKSQRDSMSQPVLADFYSAVSPITSPRGLGTQFGIPFTTISQPSEARAFVQGRIAEGSDYIKILYEPGAPIFTTISRETLGAVIEAAHAERVLAVVHVSSLQGARDAVRLGADGLAHSFSDTLVDESFAREVASRNVFVAATLSIVGAFQGKGAGPSLAADKRLSPYLRAAQRTALSAPGPGPDFPLAPYLVRFSIDRGIENVRRLKAAGVRILAGTDAPNLGSHGVSLHGELELLTRAGLSPGEALTAATLGPAQAFRLADRGRVAVGMLADLVMVEGNPVVDITATRAITRVFKNGFEVSRALPPVAASPTP
jgi:imidazolonepropionase-like amidohydrolase